MKSSHAETIEFLAIPPACQHASPVHEMCVKATGKEKRETTAWVMNAFRTESHLAVDAGELPDKRFQKTHE